MEHQFEFKIETPDIVAVDLFCGVGGLTHGLQLGGVRVALGVDIDDRCRFPLESNNDTRFLKADVSKLKSAVVKEALRDGKFSLLAGCAPCQPFSTYSRGARAGSRADDWRLVEEFSRLVLETKPDLVTMENVPPLARQDVFKVLLRALDGYHVSYDVLQCADLGVPQTRKRLVLLASKFGPIELPEPRCERPTVRDVIGDLPKIDAGKADAKDGLHLASRLSQLNLRRIRASRPGGTWRDWSADLRADCHVRDSGGTYPSVYGRMEWDAPSPTITTQCFGYGNGRFGHPEQDRAISLREAAMLQTFPKNYRFVPEGEKISFATLGRFIGNAVPVKLGQVIAQQLISHVKAVSAVPT